MYTLKPWNKEVERIMRQLAKDRVVYIDNVDITRKIGRNHSSLFDEANGFMDIGKIERRNKSMIALRPGVGIAPVPKLPSVPSKFIKFKFYRIF